MTAGRHAVLLAVHRNPELVERLVRSLRHPRVDVFIHVDSRVDEMPYIAGDVRSVKKRFPVVWNGFGLVEATLNWLRQAHREGPYDTYTYLSGQDFLLKPIDAIVAEWDSGEDLLVDMQWSDTDRVSRWGEFHITDPDPLRRFLDKIRHKLLPWNKGIRKLPAGLEFACGSALWTLSGPSVDWMLRFLKSRPDIVGFFRNTLHSDEMFYQMVLKASPYAERLGKHGHFIDWSRKGPHPAVLGLDRLGELLASGKSFARKIDPERGVELLAELERLNANGVYRT